jgi:hypothetical protein
MASLTILVEFHFIMYKDTKPGSLSIHAKITMNGGDLDRDSLALQPLETRAVLGQEWRDLLQALGVVGVEPFNLQVSQERALNQLDLHGNQGNVLESEIATTAKVVAGVGLANQHNVLDTDSKLAILVVTGLVSQGHTRNERDIVVRNAGTASVRALVDVQEGTNSVASTVTEVKTIRPKSTTSQDIQKVSRGAFGKDSRVDRDVSLKNTGEAALLVSRGSVEVEGTGNIGGSINVLSARVAKVDKVGVDASSIGLFGLVVDDGSVGSRGRNGVERKTDESSLLTKFAVNN